MGKCTKFGADQVELLNAAMNNPSDEVAYFPGSNLGLGMVDFTSYLREVLKSTGCCCNGSLDPI